MTDRHTENAELRRRLGDERYRKRLRIQKGHDKKHDGRRRTLIQPEHVDFVHGLLTFILKVTGFYRRGRRNALNFQLTENHVILPDLPRAFEGFRLLHLSDLHLDLDTDINNALIEKLKVIPCDASVITGDFRDSITGDFRDSIAEARRMIPHLRQPVFSVMGNHDFIEQTPLLENAGIRILLNENAVVEKDGQTLHIAGIDDPHFYQTEDIPGALRDIPDGSPVILLSHTAEIWREAEAAGVDLLLCGHTHGGQFCLPGGFALMHNAAHPRTMSRGAWRHGNLQGYTSRGAGCCIIPVRYNALPEITVHILHGATPSSS